MVSLSPDPLPLTPLPGTLLYRQRFAANYGCSQAEEGMARPGNSAESPTNRCSKQGRYARYGSATSANILCRALSSNSYEGWPRARRMINLLA